MTDFIKIADKTEYISVDDAIRKVVVGGSTDYFAPSVNISYKLESGTEKYFVNICDDDTQVDTSKVVETLDKDLISVRVGDVESTFKTKSDRLKIERIFYKIPTEAPKYKLMFSKGVSFYYQGELTEEEVTMGCVRPDNVIGSYAIYCDKQNHYKTKDGNTVVNYRTGKLGHLYAPYWTDAVGKITKGIQLVENGILTYALPSLKWLASAVLPIKLDPDFGYDSSGTPGTNSSFGGTITGSNDAPADGTLDSVTVYYSGNNANDSIGLVYNDSGDRIAYSTLKTDVTTGWNEYILNDEEISSGTTYWIGRVSASTLPFSFDSGSAGDTVYKGSNWANPPDDPLTSTSSGPWLFGAYATYTMAAGGSTLSPIKVNAGLVNSSLTVPRLIA